MQSATEDNDERWRAFSFRLRGYVQSVGLRASILHRAHSLGIGGWIHNSESDAKLVIGQFGGESELLNRFAEWLKVEMGARKIEIERGLIPLHMEDLPLPASRMPNTPRDTDSRLDKGIELLQDISTTLVSMDGKLNNIDGKLDNIDGKLDQVLDEVKKVNTKLDD